MAFHLHLINTAFDWVNAAPFEFGRGPAEGPARADRPVLQWAMGTDGKPTARWILARD